MGEFAREIWFANPDAWKHFAAAVVVLTLPLWLPVPGEFTGAAGMVVGFVGGFELCMAILYPTCCWSVDQLKEVT